MNIPWQSYYPRVGLHPASIKALEKGHPWITKDSLSLKFPSSALLLVAKDQKQEIALLLHDPQHPKIKARLWQKQFPFDLTAQMFGARLAQRLAASWKKRSALLEMDLSDPNYRNNLYLSFGEADELPGLHIQLLGENILVQFFASFWQHLTPLLYPILAQLLLQYFPHKKIALWQQERGQNGDRLIRRIEIPGIAAEPKACQFLIREYGINLKVQLDVGQDYGIYTDMASVRHKLINYFHNKKVINLFAYTGAFSLLALQNGAQKVVSVDLSAKNLEWLKTNLQLNPHLPADRHEILQMPTSKAFSFLQKKNEVFDMVICDPPTASTDGRKKTQALKNYQEFLVSMMELIGEGHLLIFLNKNLL